MRKLLTILSILILTISIFGQPITWDQTGISWDQTDITWDQTMIQQSLSGGGAYFVRNGMYFKRNGSYLKPGSVSPTPDPPDPPDPSDFTGTIEYIYTFGNLASDSYTITDANIDAIFETGTVRAGDAAGELYTDSIINVTNDKASADTVLRVEYWNGGSSGSSYGIDYYIPIADADSLNLTWYQWVDSNFDYDIGGGGKSLGLGGWKTNGDPPASGGVSDCGCNAIDGGLVEMCDDDGFLIRAAYHYQHDEFGVYAYANGEIVWPGYYSFPTCGWDGDEYDKRYGLSWYPKLLDAGETAANVPAETWVKMSLMLRLDSSAGAGDGYIKWALNDTVRVDQTGLDIRGVNGVFIDRIVGSVFDGGNSAADEIVILIDDMIAWTADDVWSLEKGDVMTNIPESGSPNCSYE